MGPGSHAREGLRLKPVYVSCRRDFWSDTVAMPVRWRFEPGNGVPFVAPGDKVLVLVHGYRTSREGIERAYGAINDLMWPYYDHIFGWLYPAGSIAASFWTSERRARAAAREFLDFCRWLTDACGCTVDVETHSLGALVATHKGPLPARNLLLTAAAIGNHRIPESTKTCKKVLIYHSRGDRVLRVAFRWLARFGFRQALGFAGPAGIEGIPSNVEVIDCSGHVEGHGGYARSEWFFANWQDWLDRQGKGQQRGQGKGQGKRGMAR